MKISHLSLAELKKLQTQVERAIVKKQQSDTNAARKEVEKILAKRGLSLNDLVSINASKTTGKRGTVKKNSTKKVAPKYVNPNDKKVTWSGRGRTPLWVTAHLKSGGKIEDLAIKS